MSDTANEGLKVEYNIRHVLRADIGNDPEAAFVAVGRAANNVLHHYGGKIISTALSSDRDQVVVVVISVGKSDTDFNHPEPGEVVISESMH